MPSPDFSNDLTHADAVKAIRTKFPEFSGMSDSDVAATMAEADASSAYLKAYDPSKSISPEPSAPPATPRRANVSVGAPTPPSPIPKAIEDFRKSAALPDNVPPDILEEVLREHKPELFKSQDSTPPGSSSAADTADAALKIAIGYALPKVPDSLQRLVQANAAGTLSQAADVAGQVQNTPGVSAVSNLSEPLKRAAATVMPPGPLSKGERFLAGDKKAAAEAIAPTKADIEKESGGGNVPYFDIARKTLADTLAPLIPNPLNPVEDAMWAALPNAERAAVGQIAEGVGIGKIHPVLRGYVQSGVLGAAVGAIKAPDDGQATTYMKQVGEGLAAGIILHGMASGIDSAAQELGIGKIAAYQNLRQTVIDQFVEKGVYPKEAAAMADFGIDQAIKTGGKWEDVTAADLRAAKAAILRGEKLVLGNAEEPVEPAQVKGPVFDASAPAESAEAPPPAAPAPNITTVDGNLLGGPDGVQRFKTEMPTLAENIVGKDLPFSPDVVSEGLSQAQAIHDTAIRTGADPNDAQISAAKAFTDYLDLVKNPKNVPDGTISEPTAAKPPLDTSSFNAAATKMALPDALDLEPHELTFNQFKAVHGEAAPERQLMADYKMLVNRAIKEGKPVSNPVLQSLISLPDLKLSKYAPPEESAPTTLNQSAFHGSPHKFDKFSLQKIGTGEGNQTFGWGLYFAGKKDVAEYYRDALSPPQEIPANVRLALGSLDNLGFGSLKAAVYGIKSESENWKNTWDVKPERSEKEAKAAKVIDDFLANPPDKGHLYHVDIPEDGDYLNWDKPLSEQPDIEKAIRTLPEDTKKIFGTDWPKFNGEKIYRGLSNVLGPEEASRTLNSVGIPGLRYLDQGSRDEGHGTYNYVMFDDSKVKILGVHEPPAGFDLRKSAGTEQPGLKQTDLQLQYQPTQSESAIALGEQRGDVSGQIMIKGEKIGRALKEAPFAIKYQKDGFLIIPDQEVKTPADIAFAFRSLKDKVVENFLVGAVKNGRIVSVEHIATGTFDEVNAHPFEAIHFLDHSQADSYFIVHNHPSGHTEPSPQDMNLTRVFQDIFSKNGLELLGHVIINDTHFGFIDKSGAVAQYEHKDYAETKKIPLLKKYAEWSMSKGDYASQPAIESPKAVYEIAKGIQTGKDEAVAFFLNVQNRVNASVILPKGQLTAANLQTLAGRYRGAALIIANPQMTPAQLMQLRSQLKPTGVRLLDTISVTDHGYSSSVEYGVFEKPGEYVLRDMSMEGEYEAARKAGDIQPKETVGQFMQQRKNVIADFFKYIGQVSSKSLYNIGPSLMYATRRFESDYRQQIKKDLIRSMDFLQGLSKLKKAGGTDHLVMDLAMKNGDMAMQTQIAQEHGFLPALNEARLLLQEMRGRIQSVGYEVGYRDGYFPRVIRDSKGLRKYFEKQDEIRGEIDLAIQEKEFELGRQLNDDEKANLINSFIRGFVRSKVALAKTGNMKRREIEKVTVGLNRFYYSGREGLIRYIEQVNEAVEARKFFGRVEVKPGLDPAAKAALAEMSEDEKKQSALSWNNIGDSIGAYVNRLLDQRKISPSQQLELKNIFMSRFGYIGTTGAFGLYKNVEYMSTIANPISALSTLDSLGAAIYMGPWNTPGSFIRALANKSKISLQDLGLQSVDQEVREASRSSAAMRALLKVSGFSAMERVTKETYTNAVIDSYRTKAKNGDPDLDAKLVEMFGSQADNVLDDLKAGRTSENVLFLAFNELSDYLPMTLLEVPRAYLDAPGGRIFYMLKTFMIKRLDFIASQVSKAPDKKTAIKNFLRLYAIMAICGMGVDVAKDFVLNRRINPTDLLIDNMLKPFGISKFLLYRIRDYGLGELLSNILTPSHKLLDSIWKDVTVGGKMIKVGNHHESKDLEIPGSIPIGGKLWYWWFGRGAQKERAKEFKEEQPHRPQRKQSSGGLMKLLGE